MRHFGKIAFKGKSVMAYYSARFHQKSYYKNIYFFPNQRKQKSYEHIEFYRFAKKVFLGI